MSGTCCTPCQPFTERHGHCQRVLPGTRGRAGARARAGRSERVQHWSGCPCMRTERPRASLTSVPAHDPRIPQRGTTHTKIGPPRRARVDARDARERTSHGPRSASNASAAAPGGRSARLGASDRARAIAPRSHEKSSKIYQPFPTSLPLMVKKKVLRGQKKKVPIFFPPTSFFLQPLFQATDGVSPPPKPSNECDQPFERPLPHLCSVELKFIK